MRSASSVRAASVSGPGSSGSCQGGVPTVSRGGGHSAGEAPRCGRSSTARAAACPVPAVGVAGSRRCRMRPDAVGCPVAVAEHPDAEVVQPVGVPVIHLAERGSVTGKRGVNQFRVGVAGVTISQSGTAVMTLPCRVDGDHWSSCRGCRQGRTAIAKPALRVALSLIGCGIGLGNRVHPRLLRRRHAACRLRGLLIGQLHRPPRLRRHQGDLRW